MPTHPIEIYIQARKNFVDTRNDCSIKFAANMKAIKKIMDAPHRVSFTSDKDPARSYYDIGLEEILGKDEFMSHFDAYVNTFKAMVDAYEALTVDQKSAVLGPENPKMSTY